MRWGMQPRQVHESGISKHEKHDFGCLKQPERTGLRKLKGGYQNGMDNWFADKGSAAFDFVIQPARHKTMRVKENTPWDERLSP